MSYKLPDLPYAKNALEPHISAETLEFHHDKHHAAYVNNLNDLVPGTEFEGQPLEHIVMTAPAGAIFNNAAQVWNHSFYWWQSLKPKAGSEPPAALKKNMEASSGEEISCHVFCRKPCMTIASYCHHKLFLRAVHLALIIIFHVDKFQYPLSGDVFGRNSVQRARFNAVPTSHAHVLKHHGLLENAINLFNHVVRTF